MPYFPEQMKTVIKNRIAQVKKAVYTVLAELQTTAWITSEPVPFAQRTSGVQKTLAVGEQWGLPGAPAWFLFSGVIPPAAAGRNAVLLINIGGEACVFDSEGCPVQGLTNQNSSFDRALGEPGKRVVYLAAPAQSGLKFSLWVQGESRDLFGKYRDGGRLIQAHLAICRETVRTLYYDLAFLNDLMLHLPPENARQAQLLFHLYAAVNRLPEVWDAPEQLLNAPGSPLQQAAAEIARDIRSQGGTPSLTVSALGNSHIDLAWLWPLAETVYKGARTFATALTMLERYPDYLFGASQPQLYLWLKTSYPCMYAKITARVGEGRWEPLGGMWVESDTNIPGGESLVRQVLYGKRFFQQEFERESALLWLPDSFGFSGALPQIARKAGLDCFCSTKPTWNLYNRLPHHTFIWKGIDGSALLAHIPPEGTYNSSAAPHAVLTAEKNYLDKGVAADCLMLFGIGDGGGGPGEEHLEWLRREKNCAGLAPVRQETAAAFFARLNQGRAAYQTWEGEIYLERHQGTYTTQARSKRSNRRIELALRDLELWAALAAAFLREPYPAREIELIWKEVLLYQFHDIMAGSAIHQVYRESLARYEILLQNVRSLQEKVWQAWARAVDSSATRNPLLVFNSTSWPRREWLCLNQRWRRLTVPALGYLVAEAADGPDAPPYGTLAAADRLLENNLLRLELAPDGSLAALYDKANQRQVLAAGQPGNRLAVYQDDGDAWDIPRGYADREPDYFQLERTESWIDGPRACLRQVYRYGNSHLEQILRLTQDSPRIDFVTTVDWRERRKMLRSSFAVAIRNPETRCEIQFGNIGRPNTSNTSWETAKYEVCAHKWVDLSDGGYGVALLNDCKYGYKLLENILDIDLLRSPVYPDPLADEGVHQFTYSLYPHPGNYLTGRVVQAGYELNVPLQAIPLSHGSGPLPDCRPLPACHSFLEPATANIIVETVKKAEDDDGLIIRLYECGGMAARIPLAFAPVPAESCLVDLMEQPCDQTPVRNGRELAFGPFEIHTLKIKTGPF